ncbi:MAG: class I SAM-dependent methyltransferase, partial [Minisyncoccota bacterium]
MFIYPIAYDALSLYDADYFAGATKGSGYVEYDTDKEPMRPAFIEYLKEVDKFAPRKGELLDVGAATGFFMKIADEFGWRTKGVEISDYATTLAQKRGLDVRCGTLVNSGFAERNFDAITMWDVLEHFADPQVDIRIAEKLLRPGGILAINTPDSGSLYARMMGKRWHLLVPPEHINYFTKKSVTALLRENGFSIEKISKIGKSFTLEYVVQTAATCQKSGVL